MAEEIGQRTGAAGSGAVLLPHPSQRQLQANRAHPGENGGEKYAVLCTRRKRATFEV